ncbi:MAG TPA: UDP-N-acetylenolpyruvoylglucosamine reductase, partial [Firmicutes bacterium]|nr:UDP-N-acetylenolpyruvoylglucosamine reductase [Bacillota bacterium]
MTNEILEQLQAEFPHAVRLGELMQNHTSFRLGGPALALAIPNSIDELKGILAFCQEQQLPLFVMGNGSNLLVRDGGIRAVVVKISGAMSTVVLTEQGMEAEAGISLSALAHTAVEAGLGGLEFAAGIPGSLGGGVIMNAGAYGGEMKDVVAHVIALDYRGQEHRFDNEQLHFGYRKCALQGQDLIVAQVGLRLREQDPAISRALIIDYNERRRSKQPLHLPSAGSVFKRPPGQFAGQLIEQA